MPNDITAAGFAEDVKAKRRQLSRNRAAIAAKLLYTDSAISASMIDDLVEIAAQQDVLGVLDEDIERMLEKGTPDSEVLALVVERFEHLTTSVWQPNSTSNVFVEVELKKHFYCIEVLKTLRGTVFASI